MAKQAGYWVDLRGVKFDEGSTATWIQAMPIGAYDHPVHGTIEITPERVQRFAQNVKENVRTQQLDIDFDHKDKSGEAAGWVQDAEARPDGLWLLVDWTKNAAQKIKDKAYRYFSPEFVDEWTHPKTQQTYKDVLFGGGITNRPFLKDILPINMSEVFAQAADQNKEGESSMDEALRKSLAKRFGLPDDATEDQVMAKVNEAPEQQPPKQEEKEKQPVAASETSAALKKLAEDNPAVKALMDTVNMQGEAIKTMTKSLREKDIESSVTKLSEKAKSKGFALPPATQDELRKALSEEGMTTALSEAVYSSFEKLLDLQVVELAERGSAGKGDRQETTGVQKFNEKVEALMKADPKLAYADATVLAASQNPQLFEEYREESYSGRE